MLIRQLEKPNDLEMSFVEMDTGVYHTIGAVIIITKNADGGKWCNDIIGGHDFSIWHDIISGKKAHSQKEQFFVTIEKGDDLRRWLFEIDECGDEAKRIADDIAIVLGSGNVEYLCSAIPQAGLIFNGFSRK